MQLHFFGTWISSFPSTICEKDYSSSMSWSWHLCLQSIPQKCVGLFEDSQFYSTGLYVYPVPVRHSLDFCIFVVSFETAKCELSNILYQIVLANFDSLDFHMNFNIDHANFWGKRGSWNLGIICRSVWGVLPCQTY